MPTNDETEEPRARRRARSRGLGGLRDSTRGADGPSLNDAVRGRAVASPPADIPLTESETTGGISTDAPPDFTPRGRMQAVQLSSRANAFEKEYRLSLLHRMLMRRVPLDQIAQELGISLSSVMKDRAELRTRLSAAAKQIDLYEMIGDSLAFYNEVKGMNMRTASAAKMPIAIRLTALRTALAAENDKHRFLTAVGFYEAQKFRNVDSSGEGDIAKLISLTEHALGIASAVEDAQNVTDDDNDVLQKIELF